MIKLVVIISLGSALFWLKGGTATRQGPISESSENILRGARFKVYGFEYPPFMHAVRDSTGNITIYQGLTVEFINYIAKKFSLSLEYVPEDQEEVKRIGQGMASFNAIKREKLDFSTSPFHPIGTRLLVDVTTLANQENYILLCPYPEEESRLTAVIRPFNYFTWIMICASTLAIILFITVLISLYYYWRKDFNLPLEENSDRSFARLMGAHTMHTLSILSQQGVIKLRLSFRIMMGLWLLMSIVIINLYGSTLTSYLTVTKLKPIPMSLEELIAASSNGHKKCLLTMQKDHRILEMLKDSKYPPYQKINEWVTRNPQFFTTEHRQITDNVVNHGCAHLGTPISSGLRVAVDFKTYGKCRMTISKSLNFDVVPFVFRLPKNSPYTDIVNHYLLQAIAAGLMEYWKKWSTTLNLNVCRVNNKQDSNTKVKSIKLVELSSAFFVLGLGTALAALAFLLEKIVWLCETYSKKRDPIIVI